MLFDTDVLIWLLKGNIKAANLINKTEERFISIITFMELLKGAFNKKELINIKSLIKNLEFNIISINENICHRALIYIEEYCLQTGINIVDALIAATASENSLVLCTGNYKDFKEINDIKINIFRYK